MGDMVKKAGKFALLGPIGYLISDSMTKSSEEMDSAKALAIEKLREEAARQEILMSFQQHQARVAQEMAIAERISNAAVVEIEEFYDLSGNTELGLKANGKTEAVSIGLEAEARKVTRRIYRFSASPDQNWTQPPVKQDIVADTD